MIELMHFSLPLLVFVVVMLSWIAFAIVFIVNKPPVGGPAARRESKSIVGIALQGVSYAIVWMIHRRFFSPITALSQPMEIVLAAVTAVLAIASVSFCAAAVRALGKQWSLEARVVEGHNLIMHGPYRIVRNPIYTGMSGLLIATGLAVSHWIGLIAGLVVFAIGTFIRVRSEEKLLSETFGSQWDEYARRVPAVVPLII